MLTMCILVPIIMACAMGGTIGLIKLIKKFLPDVELPKKYSTKNEQNETEKK